LAEFWAKRWNLAFSEMTAIALYRPLASSVGKTPALVLSFLFSGAIHEVVVSLPVRAGYGLPFAFFTIHGALVAVERRLARAGHPVERSWLGRVWTVIWLVAPVPLLFHPW